MKLNEVIKHDQSMYQSGDEHDPRTPWYNGSEDDHVDTTLEVPWELADGTKGILDVDVEAHREHSESDSTWNVTYMRPRKLRVDNVSYTLEQAKEKFDEDFATSDVKSVVIDFLD